MNSLYEREQYNSAAIAVGLEMDMEVKSEPESENETCDSTTSITSSVEEVPFTLSSHSQSEEELEEPEDEPLVEINSITVPQEVVEVKLQPTLLLFVNKDFTSSSTVRPTEVSTNLPITPVKEPVEKSFCNEKEDELANRKAITRALRNFKRESKSSKSSSSEIDNNKNLGKSQLENNFDLCPEEEVPSPSHSSSETGHDRSLSPFPPNNKNRKHKVINRKTRNKAKFKQKKRKKKVVENKKLVKSLSSASDNDSLLSPSIKRVEQDNCDLDKVHGGKENTQYNKENLSTKENKPDYQNDFPLEADKLVSKSNKSTAKKDNKHEKMVKPESYDCTVCNKKFRLKSHLATHSRAHVNIRKFKCNECGNLYKTKANLYFHMKTHEEAPFFCEKCNKTFPERKILTRHIRVVHSGEGSFNCNQCGRSFKCASSLELHYTLHTGNKPYACKICDKTFVYKSTYTLHMKGHSADDMFSCELCPSDATSKGELRRRCHHHSDARPWLCTVCGKGYPLKGTLKNHMKSHESDKPFKPGRGHTDSWAPVARSLLRSYLVKVIVKLAVTATVITPNYIINATNHFTRLCYITTFT
ncbi:hypothetical protein J6590_002533 [Homalodisca vitripennis]|nr:hypothetical protein J6590_002533 [Homalodisca vitripennis]